MCVHEKNDNWSAGDVQPICNVETYMWQINRIGLLCQYWSLYYLFEKVFWELRICNEILLAVMEKNTLLSCFFILSRFSEFPNLKLHIRFCHYSVYVNLYSTPLIHMTTLFLFYPIGTPLWLLLQVSPVKTERDVVVLFLWLPFQSLGPRQRGCHRGGQLRSLFFSVALRISHIVGPAGLRLRMFGDESCSHDIF